MLTVLGSVAVLWLPGAAIARICRLSIRDPLARLGYQFALGLCFWPVLLLITSLIGLRWGRWAVVLGSAGVLAGWLGGVWRRRSGWRRDAAWSAAGTAAFLMVVWTRVSHVSGVVWPLWVDSVHHTMILRLILEQGTLPASYAPFIPESTFYYHWGFHAAAAFAAWLCGATDAAELPRFLLVFGQVLNALIFFAVYAGAKALLRKRSAALLAATLATLVSFFPAYYVSWGRYTQLAGLLVLPPLAASYWMLARHPSRGRAAMVAILAAGLLLIHIRVAVIFAILAAILTIVLAIQRRWRGLTWCAAAAAIAIVLASPWLVRLARAQQTATILDPATPRWETSNAAPADLLWAPNQVPLYVLGTGGLAALLPLKQIPVGWRIAGIVFWLAIVVLLQRRGRARGHLLARLGILAAWVAVAALLINLPRVPRVVPNSAAIVMLFLPLSIAGALLVQWMVRRRAWTIALTVILAIAGALRMREIINPVTLLVTPADVAALRWIGEHTPPSATFAVGVQPWIADSYIGVDGGYWIPLVADRRSILPPGLYPWVMPAERVDRVTETLAAWHAAELTGDAGALRAMGVTHVYFGAKNARPLRSAMTNATRIYERDGVEIYALTAAR